jgi:hypothetical protein
MNTINTPKESTKTKINHAEIKDEKIQIELFSNYNFVEFEERKISYIDIFKHYYSAFYCASFEKKDSNCLNLECYSCVIDEVKKYCYSEQISKIEEMKKINTAKNKLYELGVGIINNSLVIITPENKVNSRKFLGYGKSDDNKYTSSIDSATFKITCPIKCKNRNIHERKNVSTDKIISYALENGTPCIIFDLLKAEKSSTNYYYLIKYFEKNNSKKTAEQSNDYVNSLFNGSDEKIESNEKINNCEKSTDKLINESQYKSNLSGSLNVSQKDLMSNINNSINLSNNIANKNSSKDVLKELKQKIVLELISNGNHSLGFKCIGHVYDTKKLNLIIYDKCEENDYEFMMDLFISLPKCFTEGNIIIDYPAALNISSRDLSFECVKLIVEKIFRDIFDEQRRDELLNGAIKSILLNENGNDKCDKSLSNCNDICTTCENQLEIVKYIHYKKNHNL